jgi:hypothetical protein
MVESLRTGVGSVFSGLNLKRISLIWTKEAIDRSAVATAKLQTTKLGASSKLLEYRGPFLTSSLAPRG